MGRGSKFQGPPAAVLAAAVIVALMGAVLAAQGPYPYSNVLYPSPSQLPLDEIKLPPGFQIALYVNASVPNARTMVRSGASNGSATIIYVSTQDKGSVHAILDRGSDGQAEEVCTLLTGLDVPEGLLWNNGSLYVFETTTLRRYDGIDNAVLDGCKPLNASSGVVILDWFPKGVASRNMVLGPDGLLYIVVSSPANVADCLKVSPYGLQQCSIVRMRMDGSGLQTFASGVRNAVGLDFDSSMKNLYFALLARDLLGEDQPDDLIFSAPVAAASPPNFGFPYCHWEGAGPPELRTPGPGVPLPDDLKVAPQVALQAESEDPAARNATLTAFCHSNVATPIQAMGPHVATLGIKFATNNSAFPPPYSGNGTLFVAEHGSWYRTKAIGYRIAVVQLDPEGKPLRHEVFASGWLRNANTAQQQFWGRPANLLFLPDDGSLLVSDDFAGAVYRITYTGQGAGK